MVSLLTSYLVTLRLLSHLATNTEALLIVNLIKKSFSSSMILSKNLIELTTTSGLCFNIYLIILFFIYYEMSVNLNKMLKYDPKVVVNSIRFLLGIINDERSFFIKFTVIRASLSVATSNNNRNVIS